MYEIWARNVTKWHEMETQNREVIRHGYYVPRIKEVISLTLGNVSKKYTLRYHLLKVGYNAVRIFLFRIKVIETLKCWWCGATKQTVEHLYIQYQK